MDKVGVLILAADGGEAFGGSLAAAPWGDGVLVEHLVAVATPHAESVVVVLGADADEVVATTDLRNAIVVIDLDWSEDAASSLLVGLDYLARSDDVESVVVIDGRYPQVESDVVAALLEAHGSADTPVTVPKYRYADGLPIVVDRDLWPRLMGLEGDSTVDALVRAHAEWTTELWVDQLPPRRMTSARDLAEVAPRR